MSHQIFRSSLRLTLTLLVAAVLLVGCATRGGDATAPGAAASTAGKVNVWSPAMEARRVALVAATADPGIAVLRTANNELQANVPSDFSFDTDSATLKPGMRLVLDQFAADLAQASMSQMQILIVGHTDSRGPEAAKDALSLARARAVAKYLESRGLPAAAIRVEGRGEREPVIGNSFPSARALNRRVEMFLSELGS